MNGTVAGVLAALAVVVAFAAGTMIEFEQDGDINLTIENDGAAEQIGEAIDEAVQSPQQ